MSDEPIDLNKIIPELVLQTGKSILSSAAKYGTKQYKSVLAILELCFKNYLKETYKKYSKTKTLLYRDKPVPLSKFYVSTNVKIEDTIINTEEIDMLLENATHQIFVGTAGCGKTTFLKYLFLRLIEEKRYGIPVFIELRLLNTQQVKSLEQYVFKCFNDLNSSFDNDQFDKCMKSGKLILLLDGFDEIDYSIRKLIAENILSITNRYKETRILLASRPDETFIGWQEFSSYNVLPLSKELAINLIKKVDYDKVVKERFLDELESGLFEKHKDFLSNPLLLTMMLLTYEQIAEIPSKMHIFYNQAFDTLFNKHDAIKSLYKRKTYAGMPVDDFKRILSSLSITSYIKGNISFSRSDIDELLEGAKKLSGIEFDNDNYLKDLLESVCILYKDGLFYSFTHRSFQEYFAAVFLSRFNDPRRKQILEKITIEMSGDNVLKLLFDINSEVVEQDLFMPILKTFFSNVGKIEEEPYKYIRILNEFFVSTDLIDDRVMFVMYADRPIGYLFHFLFQCYPDCKELFSEKKDKLIIDKNSAKKIFQKIGQESISFYPPDEEKHKVFMALCFKERADYYLSVLNHILKKLNKKYQNRSTDIDSLLFG